MAGARLPAIAVRVTLPLLRPAMLSTLTLLFIRGIESFEVPRIIGLPARIPVFATEIQEATSAAPPRFGVAGALSLILLALCVVSVVVYRRATANADAFATVTGKGHTPTRQHLGPWRWPVGLGMVALFAIALGLPLFFTSAWSAAMSRLPSNSCTWLMTYSSTFS